MIKNADGLLDIFWKPESGPIENILGLVEYGYMFLGGMWGRIAITIATILGLSLRDLGRKLDEMFSLQSLGDLANMPEDTASEAMFKGSTRQYKYMISKLGRSVMDKQTAFDLLFGGKSSRGGFLQVLKAVAKKIMTGGLLSFLTLKGVQAAKEKKLERPTGLGDANKTPEDNKVENSKKYLESAIKEALAS